MLPMPPLSHAPLSSLAAWHADQQPLVSALAEPVVDEMTAALEMMQTAVDERDRLLASFAAQVEASLVQLGLAQTQMDRMATQNEVSQATVGALSGKLETATDRIDVLERKAFGRLSEKRKPKTPDAKRAARSGPSARPGDSISIREAA